jgi:hypothetical protein
LKYIVVIAIAILTINYCVSPLFPEQVSPVQHFGPCLDQKGKPAFAQCVSDKMAVWDNQQVVAPPKGQSLASIRFFNFDPRD